MNYLLWNPINSFQKSQEHTLFSAVFCFLNFGAKKQALPFWKIVKPKLKNKMKKRDIEWKTKLLNKLFCNLRVFYLLLSSGWYPQQPGFLQESHSIFHLWSLETRKWWVLIQYFVQWKKEFKPFALTGIKFMKPCITFPLLYVWKKEKIVVKITTKNNTTPNNKLSYWITIWLRYDNPFRASGMIADFKISMPKPIKQRTPPKRSNNEKKFVNSSKNWSKIGFFFGGFWIFWKFFWKILGF